LGRKKLCVAAQHDLKGAKATSKVTRAGGHWQFLGRLCCTSSISIR
jgi:hypothetical protein